MRRAAGLGALYCCLVLITGVTADVTITALNAGSPARHVYGDLSGWWCALYACGLARTRHREAIPFVIGYMILPAFFSYAATYHDDAGPAFPLIVLAQAVLLASPVIINAVIVPYVEKAEARVQSWVARNM